MKFFRKSRKGRLGFSLVETTISIGIFGVGFTILLPLLGLGLTSSRQSRDTEMAAQIARTIEAQGREGTLPAGAGYRDGEGAVCAPADARFLTQVTETALGGSCTRLVIQVAPVNAPDRPSSYAVLLPPP